MASTDKNYDAIIVGGGHNGLVNGAYLAKAGLKVLIVERRHLVGGAAITEELRPGFHFTSFSYALSLLRPDIVQELDLVKHGFMPILMPSSFAPMENGDYLLLGQDRDENIKEIMRHSSHDADAMDRYEYDVERVCQVVKPLLDKVPPNIFGKSPEDLAETADLVTHLGGVDQKVIHDLVRLLTGSAADFLDDYFESDILKGYIASSGIIGTKVGPMSQGSGLVLLYHSMGEHDGHFGAWAFHKGGNGGFTQVLARAAQAYGAEIMLNAPVDSVITKEGAAVGVALEDGTELTADDRRQRARPAAYVHRAGRAPRAAQRPGREHQPAAVPGHLGEGQLRPRRRAEVSRPSATAPTSTSASSTSGRRWSTSSGPSTTRSTAGTASARTSTAPSSRSSTRTWRRPASTSCRASCSTRRTTSRAATGTPSGRSSPTRCRPRSSRSSPASATSCSSARSQTPLDIERTVGLTEGNIFAGEFFAPQMYFFRPAPGWSQYRTPIDGYYQCGSGTHPGGCVMGAPGKLASQQILRDLKSRGDDSV